ncbi:hypothetical protein OAG77_01785, partial [bacterium]|nr:hypothetical protein [bacterium]
SFLMNVTRARMLHAFEMVWQPTPWLDLRGSSTSLETQSFEVLNDAIFLDFHPYFVSMVILRIGEEPLLIPSFLTSLVTLAIRMGYQIL